MRWSVLGTTLAATALRPRAKNGSCAAQPSGAPQRHDHCHSQIAGWRENREAWADRHQGPHPGRRFAARLHEDAPMPNPGSISRVAGPVFAPCGFVVPAAGYPNHSHRTATQQVLPGSGSYQLRWCVSGRRERRGTRAGHRTHEPVRALRPWSPAPTEPHVPGHSRAPTQPEPYPNPVPARQR